MVRTFSGAFCLEIRDFFVNSGSLKLLKCLLRTHELSLVLKSFHGLRNILIKSGSKSKEIYLNFKNNFFPETPNIFLEFRDFFFPHSKDLKNFFMTLQRFSGNSGISSGTHG